MTHLETLVGMSVSQFIRKKHSNNIDHIYEIISHQKFIMDLFKDSRGGQKLGPMLTRLSRPNNVLIIDEIQNIVSAEGSMYKKLIMAITGHDRTIIRQIRATIKAKHTYCRL